MRRFCKGGQIGQIAYVGHAKKTRGQILPKFQTNRAGGMPGRFCGKTAGIEVGFITSGKYPGQHQAEVTTSDGLGSMVCLAEPIRL